MLAADGYGHLNLDVLQDESAARSFEQDTPEALKKRRVAPAEAESISDDSTANA